MAAARWGSGSRSFFDARMNFPEGDESESPRLREPNEVRQPSAGCPVGVSTAKQTSYLGYRQKRTNPDGVVPRPIQPIQGWYMVSYIPRVASQPWATGCSHVVAQKLTCSQNPRSHDRLDAVSLTQQNCRTNSPLSARNLSVKHGFHDLFSPTS